MKTPKTNLPSSRAEAVPTNLLSAVTLPIDAARKDSSFSVSKTAGMVEDGVFLFTRPKVSGAEVKKVGDLFDYSSKFRRDDAWYTDLHGFHGWTQIDFVVFWGVEK